MKSYPQMTEGQEQAYMRLLYRTATQEDLDGYRAWLMKRFMHGHLTMAQVNANIDMAVQRMRQSRPA